MKAVWKLTIEYDPGNRPRILASHIFVSKPEYAEELGRLAGLPVGKNSSSPRRILRVELFEGDPKLELLVQAIEKKLGYVPGPWLITPPEERHHFYSPRRTREYSEEDLDRASFLVLQCPVSIATQLDGTDEQVEKEVYVAEADEHQRSDVPFGILAPFHGLCAAESLARQLEQACLGGVSLEPVAFMRKKRPRNPLTLAAFVPQKRVSKPLKKLASSYIAPRSLLPVVNEQGYRVEPNTEWPCYLDDGGYVPQEFKYNKSDWEFFRTVDIALSYERTGVTKARAFRWCLVSQRFREVMGELKVPGVRYAPVRFLY
jgi:hypothetical protein